MIKPSNSKDPVLIEIGIQSKRNVFKDGSTFLYALRLPKGVTIDEEKPYTVYVPRTF
jgi:hypothetical protein